jgi:hypothetical protein
VLKPSSEWMCPATIERSRCVIEPPSFGGEGSASLPPRVSEIAIEPRIQLTCSGRRPMHRGRTVCAALLSLVLRTRLPSSDLSGKN